MFMLLVISLLALFHSLLDYEVALAAYFLLWIAWVLDHIVSIYTSMKQMCSWKFILSLSVVNWIAWGQANSKAWGELIRPKRIYFPEHFCYCFSSNLCVLNTTNTDWRSFQQNCSGVSFLCTNPTFSTNSGKIITNPISPEDPRSQKTRRRGGSRAPYA
jgi:hypothetical protein